MDPFEEVYRMQEEMERMLHTLLRGKHGLMPRLEEKGLVQRIPISDIFETEKNVVASVELPGAEKKDIELNITDDYIEIKVDKKQEHVDKKKDQYSYRSASFYRRIPLPVSVKAESADAKFENGVLRIEIPKKEKESKKRIDIK